MLASHPSGRCSAEDELAASPYAERWLYCSFNLQVDRSVDDLICALRSGQAERIHGDLVLRLQASGPRPGDRQLLSKRRKGQVSGRDGAGLELVPAVFSIGYSNGISPTTPTWPRACRSSTSRISSRAAPTPQWRRQVPPKAGGAASRDRRLEAVLDAKPAAQLRNGGLEEADGDQFSGLLVSGRPGRRNVRRSHGRPPGTRLLPPRAGYRRAKGIPRRISDWSSASPCGRIQPIASRAG